MTLYMPKVKGELPLDLLQAQLQMCVNHVCLRFKSLSAASSILKARCPLQAHWFSWY